MSRALTIVTVLSAAPMCAADQYPEHQLWPANEIAAERAEEYPWMFAGCIEVIDLTKSSEPSALWPTYDLVFEDNPAYEWLVPREDGNAPFLIGETWFNFDSVAIEALCLPS